MIATIHLEKCMTGARVIDIIIRELGYCEEPGLIVLLEIDKSLEVGFHGTVLPFGLAVGLRIEGGEKPTLHAEEVAER